MCRSLYHAKYIICNRLSLIIKNFGANFARLIVYADLN